ncbi:hypothetical protein PVAP13_1KG033950 [Panicum virgatum]|uniref:Uncharacterized protein n=1 Tax=Panicum virgatum TaxID=38727 RepID=A0A8T0XP84_PANVG|nr:hypothetical protein PVAP13_1KG033950 [Panicum virgatum]
MSSSTSTVRKLTVATILLVLVVTSASATRAFPPEAEHGSSGISTGDGALLPSPPRSSSSHSHWRRLYRLLLPLEEEKSGAGHSCGSSSKNIHCP